jgi:vitamin B12 transporter
MRLSFVAACAAAILPGAARAQANPDSPQNVVVTATRVPSKVEQLPAGVTVIDRKTLEERGYTTLVDALAAVPGLRVVQSGGPGSQASVFIRGTNSNHVLVLRDGVPINDPGDPGGAFNFGVDTLEDVERIEIVRGPMSSTYGSGAIGGVINLITRHGKGAPHGHVALAGGSPAQALVNADVSGGFGIYDYAASVQGFSTRGFDQTPRREAAIYTGEVDGDRSKLAQLELGATPFDDTRFSVLLRARDSKYGYDEVGGVAFDAGNATGYDAALFGRIGVTSTLFGGAWNTSLYLTRQQDDRQYLITLDPLDPNQGSGDSRYHGRRTDGQWNNTIHLPDESIFTASSLTFGYEHQSDQSDSKIDTSSDGFPYLSTVKAHDDTDSGYLGLQTTALQRLALTGQLREDATTIAGDAFTWRVGGVLDVPEIASHIKASYGTSFRAPALYDRYGIDSYGYVGNPHLQPEYGQGYDIGITTDLPAGGRSDAISLSVDYFSNRIHDLIETVYAANFLSSTPVNIDQARTHGVETTLTLRPAAWVQADLTYTYTDARDLDSGAQLLRRPYNQASANLRLVPFRNVVVAPELLYIGDFQDYLTSDEGVPEPYVGRSPSGVIFNLNVTWQIDPRVQLFAWGKNLGNSTFEPANGYVTPGASFLAGARVGY